MFLPEPIGYFGRIGPLSRVGLAGFAVIVLLAETSWSILFYFMTLYIIFLCLSGQMKPVWHNLQRLRGFMLLNFMFFVIFDHRTVGFSNWDEFLNSSWIWALYFTLRFVMLAAVMLLTGRLVRTEALFTQLLSLAQRTPCCRASLMRLLWMLIFAFNFLPWMGHEIRQLKMGLTARGIRLRYRKDWRRLLSFIAPVLRVFLNRADALEITLRSRYFTPEGARTLYYDELPGLVDILLFVSAMILAWVWVLR